METEVVKKLLEKYWAGESTLEEEALLREHFKTAQSQDDRPDREIFQFHDREKSKSLDEAEFKAMVSTATQGDKKKVTVLQWSWNALKVAAVIVIVFTAGWLVRNEMRGVAPGDADSFENPEEAYAETKRALEMLSRNLRKGRDEVTKFKAFSEAEKKAKDMLEINKDENL